MTDYELVITCCPIRRRPDMSRLYGSMEADASRTMKNREELMFIRAADAVRAHLDSEHGRYLVWRVLEDKTLTLDDLNRIHSEEHRGGPR